MPVLPYYRSHICFTSFSSDYIPFTLGFCAASVEPVARLELAKQMNFGYATAAVTENPLQPVTMGQDVQGISNWIDSLSDQRIPPVSLSRCQDPPCSGNGLCQNSEQGKVIKV